MRRCASIFLTLLATGFAAWSDGLETFDNENAPPAVYATSSFVGNNGVTWSYELCRDASADSGAYVINGAGLMFNPSSASKLYSSAIPGGIRDFSVKLRKGFTGAGLRQVELFVNGVSIGLSESFDDTQIRTFSVQNINVAGNVVIELRNARVKQVVLDDLSWTSLTGGDDPNISFSSPFDFGEISSGSAATQTLTVLNTGTSKTLNVTGFSPVSGDTTKFSTPTTFPLNIAPNNGSQTIQLVYTPGNVTGAMHSAVFNLNSNDPGDGAAPITLTGKTPPGMLTISNIQYNASSTNSPYNGQLVSAKGICTYNDRFGYILADAGGGAWSGIYVKDDSHGPDIGDEVRVKGWVAEPDNFTTITGVTDYVRLSVGNTLPAPVVVNGLAARSEMYEAVLVRVNNVTVDNQKVSGAVWQVSDGANSLQVLHDSTRRLYRYVPKNNATLDAIQGVMIQAGGTWRLQVRDDKDFIGRPVVHYGLKGVVMTPGGPQTNWYVEIHDDDIVYVGPNAPTVTVYNTSGAIFPGLIDTHNHQGWNSFPTLQFNAAPYGHRDDWGESDAEYTAWKSKRTSVLNHAAVQDSTKFTVGKYGEILELMAGCIAIQGMSFNIEHSHPDSGIMNLEAFPNRIYTDIFPWNMTAANRSNLMRRINGGAVQAALIHLSEGTDSVARAQFDTWYNWGMLTKETTIIHGVPYRTNEVDKIASVGASIVWSPKSNMRLYHGTANIPLYKSRGVNLAIAPDWTPSGSYNMLEELGYAWRLNQTIFSNALTSKDLVDMATINAARAAAIENRYGKIEVGYNAGLVVMPYSGGDPYLALINARPRTVLLTIVDGTPRFGDKALMTSMGFTGETINAWGTTKTLNLVKDHPFLTYGNETFASITSGLATAHATLTRTGYVDTEELQFLSLGLLQGGPDDVVPFIADAPSPLQRMDESTPTTNPSR
ncbi:MAG: amidohydrolase family protein [Kiritimatiellae bacterium]|nr:amidohydrolase family protein [Kiritimatiellia bacterium]